jgi:ditrans,polycis-polyprenyl diphosphate synthase
MASDFIFKNDVSVRVLGEISLLPEDVRKSAIDVMRATASHKSAVLNICFPYTSIHEIASTTKLVLQGVEAGSLVRSDITDELFSRVIYTEECPPVDLLIRTSGEVRLSDFMLWQSAENCQIHFLKCLWPDFSFWDMVPILITYQINHRHIKEERCKYYAKLHYVQTDTLLFQEGKSHNESVKDVSRKRVDRFLADVRRSRSCLE